MSMELKCKTILTMSDYFFKIEVRKDMNDVEKRGIGEYEDEGNLAWEWKHRRLKSSRRMYKIENKEGIGREESGGVKEVVSKEE